MKNPESKVINEEYILNRTTDTNYVYFGSRKTILDLMKDSIHRTLKDIENETGITPTSSSAILRSFRSEKYGSHTLETKKDSKGEVKYRLVINHESE